LASVVVDEININQQMVTNHLAVRYEGQSKKDIQLEHLKNRDILIQRGLHTLIEDEKT